MPGVVVVESDEWLGRRPYHRQRIALILLNQRAFTEELRAAGVEVRIVRTGGSLSDALREAGAELVPVFAAKGGAGGHVEGGGIAILQDGDQHRTPAIGAHDIDLRRPGIAHRGDIAHQHRCAAHHADGQVVQRHHRIG